jgi:hypothetical protein
VRRSTTHIQRRQSCSLLSHNHSNPRRCRYTTQQQLVYHSQRQQPHQRHSHSPPTSSDVSAEFTRSAPHNDSHPASPMLLPALTQSQYPRPRKPLDKQRKGSCHHHSQRQQPPQTQSHSPQASSDVSVEFTRSAPHNHSHPATPILLPALTQSQRPTTMQTPRYTTQQLHYHSQRQQPHQTQSHSPPTSSDVSAEFTRSAPHSDSHPAAPILLAALTQSQQPTTMQTPRYTTQHQIHYHSQPQQPTNTIALTGDIQRRQCRVHTQCAAQPLAASRADLVVCSHTITAAHDDANHTMQQQLHHHSQLQQPTNTITLTGDIQRRQCRVRTQCAAQPLASSRADVVPCSHTITAAHDDASHSIHNATAASLPLTASATTPNTFTLTSDLQRRQRRVHTQCAAQPLASSRADVAVCSHNHSNPRRSIFTTQTAAGEAIAIIMVLTAHSKRG